MRAAGTVARLAAHVWLFPVGVEAVGLRVVALLVAGGVAGDAHRVASLVAAGPVHHVAGRCLLVRIEVEPALLLCVPGNRQRLQAAAGDRDQVLLQGVDAERVGDLEVGQFAVRPVGVDEVLAVAAEEARGRALVLERGAAEVAAHRLGGGRGHRHEVVRLPPQPGRILVAADAARVVDEPHTDVRRWRGRCVARRDRCRGANRSRYRARGFARQPERQ